MKLSLQLALARIKKKRARNRCRDFDFGEVVPHVDSDSEPEHELELSDEQDQNGPAAEQLVNSDVGTGAINPAFLDASPEDLRAEALSAQGGQVASLSNAEPCNAVNQFTMDRSISFALAVTEPLIDAEKRKEQKKKAKIEAGESNTNNVSGKQESESLDQIMQLMENVARIPISEDETDFNTLEDRVPTLMEEVCNTLEQQTLDLMARQGRVEGKQEDKDRLEGFVKLFRYVIVEDYLRLVEKHIEELESFQAKISQS